MPKKMTYIVLYGFGSDVGGAVRMLEKEIDGALRRGYSLQGGVSIVYTSASNYCYAAQAVTKED